MGKGGKGGCKSNFKRKFRPNCTGSDDSDEDYVVSDEEEEASDGDLEDYCVSLDKNASEESFCGLVGEEEDEEESEDRRPKKAGKPRSKERALSNKAIRGIKRNRASYDDEEEYKSHDEDEVGGKRRRSKVGRSKSAIESLGRSGSVRSRKRNRYADYEEEEDDDDDDYEEEEEKEEEEEEAEEEEEEEVEEEEEGEEDKEEQVREEGEEDAKSEDDKEEEMERWPEIGGRPNARRSSLGNQGNGRLGLGKRHKNKEDSDYEEEEEDEDNDEDEDEDDEEFTPDEDVSLDEEEELFLGNKKNNGGVKRGKRECRKRKSRDGCKRRKKASASKERSRKRGRGRRRGGSKRKKQGGEDDYDFKDDMSLVRKKTKKNFRYSATSDSDFVSSGSSDYEFAISAEERKQVIEASNLYGGLRTSSRSLPSSKQTQNGEQLHCPSKPPARKGKEKVEEAKSEVVKRVCRICLSDEDRRRLRGTLDCCSHYFCFTCIMEWSKVESRCPLCKQRFKTISKPARSVAGLYLRDVVIQVPERDQVYQPTEEELRSYLDPYENVICTECHQGGDDGLMLLCDLCDSSAHTYCVGLGREVPEGNWYCDGCKPIALGSSSGQGPSASPDQTTPGNRRPSPVANSLDWLDSMLLASPRTPFLHGFGNLSSPRFPNGDTPTASPSSAGAPTLSRRRSLHRHIHNLLSMNRVGGMAGRSEASNGFLSPPMEQNREIMQPARTRQMVAAALDTIFEDGVRQSPSSSALVREILAPSRLDHVGTEAVHNPISTVVNGPVNLTLWPDLTGISPACSNEQMQQYNNFGSVYAMGMGIDFSTAKEQLQMTVITHLKNLSRHIDLGQGTFNDIAKCSTHTILAACELEHQSDEVDVVPPTVSCCHVRTASGADQTSKSLMKGCCSSCFDSFVKDVVKMIMDTRLPQWLRLGL